MNIGIVSGTFLPQINGVLSYVLDTATELSRRGHQVTVFAPAPPRGVVPDTVSYPFRIILLPSVPALVYPDLRITKPSLYSFTKAYKDLSLDVIHLNDPYPICIEAMIAAKLQKIPVAFTFHSFYLDKDFLKNVRFGAMAEFLKYPLRRINTNYHNYADVVIFPSLSGQQELVKSGLTARSVIIHNGIDDSLVRSDYEVMREKNRKRFKIDADAHVALFVGRLAIEKSIDVLLRAWSNVIAKDSNARFVLVGYGPMEHALKLLAKKIKISHTVIFAGCIPRTDLLRQSIYALADVYVSASRIENQSMSMIEAMAHGLPIVAINERGVSELVDSTNGILISSGSRQLARGVHALFEDDDLRRRLSHVSRVKSKKYFTSHTIQLLEQEYIRLIKK